MKISYQKFKFQLNKEKTIGRKGLTGKAMLENIFDFDYAHVSRLLTTKGGFSFFPWTRIIIFL